MEIKKLEWLDEEGDTLVALGFFGCFQIIPSWHGEFTASLNESNGHDAFEDENFKTIGEAQEYCQRFLEKQVEGALKFVDWSGAKSLKEWAETLPGIIRPYRIMVLVWQLNTYLPLFRKG